MTTLPNYRNGVGTQFPNVCTSYDAAAPDKMGNFQIGALIKQNYHILMCRRSLVTGLVDAFDDLEFNSVATGSGMSPINTVEDSNSSHYACACILDTQHRIHLFGNSLSTAPHYLRSSPADGTWPLTWTEITWPWPGIPQSGGHSVTGDDSTTYHILNRLSNGDILHYISQRDSGSPAPPEGADSLMFKMAAGSNNHVPLIGQGEFATSEFTDKVTAPDRVYTAMITVEQYPHKDRTWVMGNWRMDWTQLSTSQKPWLIYSDDLVNWKDISGAAVTMPITWVTSGGQASTNPNPSVGATVPLLHGPGYYYGSFQLWIDTAGHPHFIHQEQYGVVAWWHVWHNGTTWVDESIPTASNTPSMYIHRNGQKYFWRENGGRIKFDSVPAGTQLLHGYSIPGTWDITAYDPIQAQHGKLSMLFADGDTPKFFDFGNLAGRARAS